VVALLGLPMAAARPPFSNRGSPDDTGGFRSIAVSRRGDQWPGGAFAIVRKGPALSPRVAAVRAASVEKTISASARRPLA